MPTQVINASIFLSCKCGYIVSDDQGFWLWHYNHTQKKLFQPIGLVSEWISDWQFYSERNLLYLRRPRKKKLFFGFCFVFWFFLEGGGFVWFCFGFFSLTLVWNREYFRLLVPVLSLLLLFQVLCVSLQQTRVYPRFSSRWRLWWIQLMQKMSGSLGSWSFLRLGASLGGTWQQPWPFPPAHMGVGAELAPSKGIAACFHWELSCLETPVCSGNIKSFLANVVTRSFKWDLKISPLCA